jgi:hypothetical protein
MGTGHLREGAWINARTGQWSFVSEHGDWAKQPDNLANLGLPAAVQEAIQDIPNDCSGESRKKIRLWVMAAEGIRLRGHGDRVAIELTLDTASALPACRDVLRRFPGSSQCTASTISTQARKTLQLFCRDYEQHVKRVIGWILWLAKPLPQPSGA